MNFLVRAATNFSRRARARRAEVFRQLFTINANTKVLDLGSETGQYIEKVLKGTGIEPKNVYIADLNRDAVTEGSQRFGFTPVVIHESGALPFPDGFFDVVHCSSVIEHVTVRKSDVWKVRSGKEFRKSSSAAKRDFAQEVKRLGKQYYVQTPNRWFPLESHSWLPFLGWLPRRLLIPVLRTTNAFWVKKTAPDWNLLGAKALAQLFDDGVILKERSFGMVKSVTACKNGSVDQQTLFDKP
jgi:SAM-dependent methyltransferase